MPSTSRVLTAVELVDHNAIGPAFECGSVRWRLVFEDHKRHVYLGDDAQNRIWRSTVFEGDVLDKQLKSLAVSFVEARDELIRRDCTRPTFVYLQGYIPVGATCVLGVVPRRYFLSRSSAGEFTFVQECGSLPDGTAGTIRYT